MNGVVTNLPPVEHISRPARRQPIQRKLLLVFSGLLIGVGIAETILRMCGVSYPLPYIADPWCGTRLEPGFQGWFCKEGRGFVSVNSAGFRDQEHAIRKPAGTFRVVVLGDSYAEAVQVSQDEAFWSVLERRLGRCLDRPVEVINFGVSGFGTAQELLVLKHYALMYQPDVVLLAFLTGNDVRNNSKRLEPVQNRPFFELVDDQLVLDDSFTSHPDFVKSQTRVTRCKVWCINHSRILQALNEYRNHLAAAAVLPTNADQRSKEVGLDDHIYRAPLAADWIDAWRLTERLIVKMRDTARASGAEFVVATLTNGIQVDPDDARRKTAMATMDVNHLDYPDQRIAELGRSHGFPVVTLVPAMRDYAVRHAAHLHGFANTRRGEGHWNALGHEVAGNRIADVLCADRARVAAE